MGDTCYVLFSLHLISVLSIQAASIFIITLEPYKSLLLGTLPCPHFIDEETARKSV